MSYVRTSDRVKDFAKAAPLLLAAVGTGGVAQEQYLASLGAVIGYRPPMLARLRAPEPPLQAAPAPVAPAFDYIRSTLSASMTDVAGLFEVSRQAVYNWINGEALSAQNSARLQTLKEIAQRIEAAGFAGTPRLLQRELGSRMTLAKAIRSGRPLPPLVDRLTALLTEERRQQERLAARFGDRKTTLVAVRDAAGLATGDET